MKKVNVCHQGRSWCKRKNFFTVLYSLLLIFLCGGQALAAQTCHTASITASTPTADFVVNNDGTVTHAKTGLMWKVCSEGQTWAAGPPASCTGSGPTFVWQTALQHAKTVNAAGFATFSDWRVPNIKELASIVELQCISPSINATIFPATIKTIRYWSASPSNTSDSIAINTDFNGGNANVDAKSSHCAVRLVRGGQ